jgi:acyl carrier protein
MTELTRDEVMRQLQDVVRQVLNNDSIVLSDTTTAADINGWDSMKNVQIMLGCEKKLGVRLRARDINALENVGQMADHLLATVAKAQRK